ncbi:mannose-6-phosphate isomerase [Corynebacterium resistens DSM 45100]|uniref:mannose-6-phosphate isomerase n=1 Tax=Corynebacterium resistens (strain DSM 45100 / JCM 12819 / GTC 2026 / SICGH 158) TaxID=662755 RepID=F8E1C8_CORRG|nr:mannose-6-phosphate isomerase, class I [Corynebacterium resistens]AEI10080.1 mannose-6-phosphate isomerase [Corynebacterium resistens DSM 45100]
MEQLHGIIRNYDWGSKTALAQLSGRPVPSIEPEAEMWFGAHPGSPSLLGNSVDPSGTNTSLLDAIEASPRAALGANVAERYGRLPFLLKLLAADRALSIQVHPTKQQAEEGFARENAEGVPLDAFHRNYKDDNHKPELLVALTEFRAMAGFRPIKRTLELLDTLGVGPLTTATEALRNDPTSAGLRATLEGFFGLERTEVSSILDALLPRAREIASGTPGQSKWMEQTLQGVVKIAEQYPGDVGILVALLLNHLALQPGEAIYLDAGQLHAYLDGLGVEIMANSDNVLRGGLTSKNIDVAELMNLVTCEPLDDPTLRPAAGGHYITPAPEFDLQRLDAGATLAVNGPAIVLSVDDSVKVDGSSLASAEAVWVGASDEPVEVAGRAFIARVGCQS